MNKKLTGHEMCLLFEICSQMTTNKKYKMEWSLKGEKQLQRRYLKFHRLGWFAIYSFIGDMRLFCVTLF